MCMTATCPAEFSDLTVPAPAEAFGAEMLDTLNKAGLAMMLSIGHRTGLLDAMACGEPETSNGWARRTGLNERYVREWLAAMAAGGIVSVGANGRTFRLPEERAFFLGKDAPGGNMAVMMQWIGVLSPVESKIVDCFHRGGGLSYADYPRFHSVMAEESAQTIDLDATIALVPGLHERLTAGISVLDVGCGKGFALLELAQRYPNSRFTGLDISPEPIGYAISAARAAELRNVRFRVQDAMNLCYAGRFDLILTFDAVHDQPDPARLLSSIHCSLKQGGVYIMQDSWAETQVADNLTHPLGPFLYTISCMHCMSVSLAQQGLGLGAAWGEQLARSVLDEAGFSDVEMHRLPHDIQNAYYICRP